VCRDAWPWAGKNQKEDGEERRSGQLTMKESRAMWTRKQGRKNKKERRSGQLTANRFDETRVREERKSKWGHLTGQEFKL
jgi:hypothetical protein